MPEADPPLAENGLSGQKMRDGENRHGIRYMSVRRIYPYLLNPGIYPDCRRRPYCVPTWKTFDNMTQFTTLREFSQKDGKLVNWREDLDLYTEQLKLGRVIWPCFSTLYAENFKELVAEIKRRNLFLFDFWGYVPGSGTEGAWSNYVPPPGMVEYLEKELGDHFLGIDNGEQDGRYTERGGGIYVASGSHTIRNCVISYNNAQHGEGAGIYSSSAILKNCLIAQNVSYSARAGLFIVNLNNYTGQVINCTIVSNYCRGITVSGAQNSNCVFNCIIASNKYENIYFESSGPSNAFWYCCSPEATNFPANQSNITNDPRFMNASAGNWRLANNSPCINTGTNQNWMTNAFDLDGQLRIRYGVVDMGVYERIYEGTIYNFQ